LVSPYHYLVKYRKQLIVLQLLLCSIFESFGSKKCSSEVVVMLMFCSTIISIVVLLLLLAVIFRLLSRRSCNNGKCFIAFFHPYCNSGGGGERVLWCAIKALEKFEKVEFIIYSGDYECSDEHILKNVEKRFGLSFTSSTVKFVRLASCFFLKDTLYPRFTLLAQNLFSLIVGFEALFRFQPSVFIDTTGFAFLLPMFRYVGGCKTACYIHYPTISTDMLEIVKEKKAAYNHAEWISNSVLFSAAKLYYYKAFALLYKFAGCSANVVMVNSTWTRNHILELWRNPEYTFLVYPPCDVGIFEKIPFERANDADSIGIIAIGQFRPEKDYPLALASFRLLLDKLAASNLNQKNVKLALVGGCRDSDDQQRLRSLQKLARDIGIPSDQIVWHVNVSFDELVQLLAGATVGIHTMWNEHFGIGIVEMMASGIIVVANDSGGPKLDIVKNFHTHKVGFTASSAEEYSDAIVKILQMPPNVRRRMQEAARNSVQRFGVDKFNERFLSSTEDILAIENYLVNIFMNIQPSSSRLMSSLHSKVAHGTTLAHS
ncbi:GDP-Man:Man(3)GlcNAc(2)-PP-Dol alpha-1,2-mannosyltransferase, partial [Trichinella sp. T6]